ncbi:hypothetical protein XELAEV_18033011mg, partial [Xenopus laevis]
VNIIWSGHQTHHSSKDYNLTTALRQSFIQKYFSWRLFEHLYGYYIVKLFSFWMFYWPMAFCIPPSVFAVHIQFTLLYQFLIHTEGRNPYCIDSNYGGTLIIWDRIFGTFVPEKEKVLYGPTHPINTFEPFQVQIQHCAHIWSTFWATPGFSNKLSVIFKGPGRGPGKPRLGLPEEIPKVQLKAALLETIRCLLFLFLQKYNFRPTDIPYLVIMCEVRNVKFSA